MSPPHWREVQKKNFTSVDAIADFLMLDENLRARLIQRPHFTMNVPLRLATKMEKNTLDDPLARQFLPLVEENFSPPGYLDDPLQDRTFRRTKKLLQKYQGRALVLTTGACAMHCRFCFRKKFPYEVETKGFEQEIEAIRKDGSLDEIILSGGDPLSLSDEVLASLFQSLEPISHLKRIRFHTRFPIGIPERIDDSFLQILASSSKQIIFVIHCNHPKELDADVVDALKKIQRLGIPVLNQAVLLRSVNDEEKTLLELMEKLINGGVVPYYLHLNDFVTGSAHFDVPQERGEALVEYLQRHTSGYGVPRLVREEAGKTSKTVYI